MRFCRDGRPDDPDPLDPPGGDDLGLADPGGPDLVLVDGGLGALRPRGDPPTPGGVARTGLVGAARSPGSRWRPGDARARRTPPPTYQGTPTTRPALRASTQTPRPSRGGAALAGVTPDGIAIGARYDPGCAARLPGSEGGPGRRGEPAHSPGRA